MNIISPLSSKRQYADFYGVLVNGLTCHLLVCVCLDAIS